MDETRTNDDETPRDGSREGSPQPKKAEIGREGSPQPKKVDGGREGSPPPASPGVGRGGDAPRTPHPGSR